jgi:glutathione S-transferase
MKIYDFTMAPNPRRLRVFLAEKGLRIPSEQVDLASGKNRTAEFLAKNPAAGLPVLQLDDGTHLAESVAICRYLEGLHPDPNLFGRDFKEQAVIEQWNRRAELNLFASAARVFQNTNPLFASRIKQFKDYAEAQKETVANQFGWFDAQLKDKEFIAGPRFTIADITLLVAVDFATGAAGVPLNPELGNLNLWYKGVSSRPSAKA